MRRVLSVLSVALGGYLALRAVAEPFVIDVTNPATYRNDWGGPSLAGVLLVHCGPGVAAAVLLARWFRRRPATKATKVAGAGR